MLATSAQVLTWAGSRRREMRLRSRLEQALYEAGHDRLTGLANRHHVLTHLATHPVALAGLLDLDRFKEVNDAYGHDIGDRLLIAVAQRLEQALAGHGSVARLGGDEFLVLWSQLPAHPARHALRLLRAVCAPVQIGGLVLHPSASLGLCRSGPYLQGSDLITAADHAMYTAKTQREGEGATGTQANSSGNGSTPDHLRAGGNPLPQPGQVHVYRDHRPPPATDRRINIRRLPPDRPPSPPAPPAIPSPR